MIYFRPVENIEEAKKTLEKNTENFKPWFSVYEEGFYLKSYENYFCLMYEDGSMKDSTKGTVLPLFHGVWIRGKERQYLVGIFTLDWIVMLFMLEISLFGLIIYDFEEAGFGLIGYILFMALSFKKFSFMKSFLDEL